MPYLFNGGPLLTGAPVTSEDLRKFIIVQPVLDPADLQPGAKASEVIRQTADALHFADRGISIGLTGDIPLADDEFASVTEGAGTATIVSLILVVVILLVGLRTPRSIAAIAVTLIVGLIASAAFATRGGRHTQHDFNRFFAVLFIGIAVDFGIQFTMRFRGGAF